MSITKSVFGNYNGDDVYSYVLKNSNNMEVEILSFGGIIRRLVVEDKNKKPTDVVIGLNSIGEYEKTTSAFGALIGRFANRIANSQFTLDGITYNLFKNDGNHHLHGGKIGYNRLVWSCSDIANTAEPSVTLTIVDAGKRENYPGVVVVDVKYTLKNDNSLTIDYHATTNKKTVINLTNHSYFNLNGFNSGSINDHFLEIDADYYTPSNSELIPTGEIKSVENTPFDFRVSKKIAQNLYDDDEDIKNGNGYDHNFVLNKKDGNKPSCVAYSEESGIKMCVFTDTPGVQLYIGNFLDGTEYGKDNKPINQRTGFCLETQFFPNSPNEPEFPSCVITPEKEFQQTTIFKFE